MVFTRMFENLMTEYGDLVIMHVAGHTHSDEFRVVSVTVFPFWPVKINRQQRMIKTIQN